MLMKTPTFRTFKSVFSKTFVAFVLFVVPAANATQFDFSGWVSTVVDPAGLLDGSVGVGTTVTGNYKFDPDTVDDFPANPVFGTYGQFGDNLWLFTMGNYSISTGYKIDVVDGFMFSPGEFVDRYVLSATSSPTRQPPIITNGIDTFEGSDVNLLGMILFPYIQRQPGLLYALEGDGLRKCGPQGEKRCALCVDVQNPF